MHMAECEVSLLGFRKSGRFLQTPIDRFFIPKFKKSNLSQNILKNNIRYLL